MLSSGWRPIRSAPRTEPSMFGASAPDHLLPSQRTDMIGDLFDSPWKILIVAVVIIVLFGSAKLPAAARSLGKSMRILKTEVSSLHDDEDETKAGQTTPAQLAAASAAAAPPVAPAGPAAASPPAHAPG